MHPIGRQESRKMGGTDLTLFKIMQLYEMS